MPLILFYQRIIGVYWKRFPPLLGFVGAPLFFLIWLLISILYFGYFHYCRSSSIRILENCKLWLATLFANLIFFSIHFILLELNCSPSMLYHIPHLALDLPHAMHNYSNCHAVTTPCVQTYTWLFNHFYLPFACLLCSLSLLRFYSVFIFDTLIFALSFVLHPVTCYGDVIAMCSPGFNTLCSKALKGWILTDVVKDLNKILSKHLSH